MYRFLLFTSVLAVLGLTSCEKGLDDCIIDTGSEQVINSSLMVRTRAGNSTEGAMVRYPVHVYVFQGVECCAMKTIANEEQTLNIGLAEGTYSVYAVGGASAEDYAVPSEDDATPTTAITLRDGRSLTGLMAASATATLVDGGTNTVTLGLQRKTMLLQSITINKVPTSATAVSVTIAPLWQNLTVGGTYSGTTGSNTIALTKQDDNRTWKATANAHLLPASSQPASISVNISTPSGIKSYTYSTSDQLKEGYKITINGTYTEAVGVTLSGTITGAEWLGEHIINFDFDDNGSPSNGDNPSNDENNPSNFPSAGSTYKGCYVLASTVTTSGQSAQLTLLSPNEKKSTGNASLTLSQLETAASGLGTDGITGWRPLTLEEARLLQAAHTDLGIADDRYYLFDDSGTVKQMRMENGKVSTPTATAAYVRPVATVTISK